jgi:hypothetical protein
MNVVTPVYRVSGTMTVTDNWYAVRVRADGRLLMVGPYMPPEADGVSCIRVDPAEVPDLFDELRHRLDTPPAVFELRGE